MFQNIRISISNVGGLSLPRVTSRRGTSHETVTKRDEGGWVVLKTQILRDVIIEQPLMGILPLPSPEGAEEKRCVF